MEALQSPWVQALLWVVAAAAMVWILVPAFGFPFRVGKFEMRVSEDPLEAEPRGRDAAYEGKFRQLAAMGFRPLGKTVETAWFFTPLHWHWRSDGSRWLGSPDGTTFVSLHRVAGANPLRVSANTIFDGGGLLQTATPGVGLEIDADNDRRIELDEVDPPALIAKHAKHVEAFSRDRGLGVKQTTFPQMAAEMLAFEKRRVPKGALAGTYGILSIFILPVLAVLTSHGRMGSVLGGFRPLAICAVAALFAVIRWAVLPNRVPIAVRMAVMVAVMMVPTMLLLPMLGRRASSGRIVRALDRIEADVREGRSSAAIDEIVAYGPAACRPLLKRLEAPSSSPETRRALHGILVTLRGADLGQTVDAWRSWCADQRTGPPGSPAR